ncbi:MAG: histidinol-phosphate transaminase [Myxococcales bacterium]|nr:histidinol-phosphate transaminase [Myxococcales bacterium]
MRLTSLVAPEVRALQAYGAPPVGTDGIKLDANEHPYPLEPTLRRAVLAAVADTEFHRYPDPAQVALRAALAARFGGSPDQYIAGSGSDEAIALLTTALRAPREGRTRPSVLYPSPTFVMFGMTARLHGFETVDVPLDANFALDVDGMARAIRAKAPNLVFLATPNNPTGNAFDEAAIRTLIETDPGALFVVDEAYAAYAQRSLRHLADEYENVAIMATLSKVGFAAIRLGWVRLPPSLAAEVEKARQPYNLNTLTQRIGVEVLGPEAAAVDAAIARVVVERAALREGLTARNVHVFPSDANLLLTRPTHANAFVAKLAAKGIHVKAYREGRLAGHVRITVGTADENAALLAALDS